MLNVGLVVFSVLFLIFAVLKHICVRLTEMYLVSGIKISCEIEWLGDLKKKCS